MFTFREVTKDALNDFDYKDLAMILSKYHLMGCYQNQTLVGFVNFAFTDDKVLIFALAAKNHSQEVYKEIAVLLGFSCARNCLDEISGIVPDQAVSAFYEMGAKCTKSGKTHTIIELSL